MDEINLIGLRVQNKMTHAIGIISDVSDTVITVNYHGEFVKYPYPEIFSSVLELEDEKLQKLILEEGRNASFYSFKNIYGLAIDHEIEYLKATGGKKYKIIDGELLPQNNDTYLYAFDTDTEMHLPDGTPVKLWFTDRIVNGYVESCEDFTILIRTTEYMGDYVESVDFTCEQWRLLEALEERLDDINPKTSQIAFEVACNGTKKVTEWKSITKGQNSAFNRATSENITFIWGPPGTGKTETLANIALDHMHHGRRVLMLSYSNVSVYGALLRVASKSDLPEGKVLRYGYPRMQELLDSETLTSNRYVLHKNPALSDLYRELINEKKKLKNKDPRRVEINKKLNEIRKKLLEQETELIQNASFVATTVSKATVDQSLYLQKFDVVIFDEASMAYVPQIVFAAGIAKKFFICMGDFKQLPAIVQNKEDKWLYRDIFEHTGITGAVEAGCGHEWLVMLDTQYRMHRNIADFVSEQMYEGMLKTSEKITQNRNEIAGCNPYPGKAMALVDLSHMYSVCTKTMDGSRINIMSALMSIRLAEMNIDRCDVGIITPYNAQSRLLLTMVRDLRARDERWNNISTSTVHQFQGSEKSVIIYDAVDCFRMTHAGTLLTSLKNDTANRLFNVAMTRAKGKFVLVGNMDYFTRKNISKKLMFTQAISHMKKYSDSISGDRILDELMPYDDEKPNVYVEDRKISWDIFIIDLMNSKKKIYIDMPDLMDDNEEHIMQLIEVLQKKNREGVDIRIRVSENIDLFPQLQEYVKTYEYATNPLTVIDNRIIWFGQPLYSADFISEGKTISTDYFPCIRFEGEHTARAIKAFLEM